MSKPISKKRQLLFPVISLCLGLLLIWGVAEIGFRGLVMIRSMKFPTLSTEVDKTLGWQAVPNFDFNGTVQDADGNDYKIHTTTDKNGFKYYGNPNDLKSKRILVIGDSYTHAIEVSNDKTYYGLLADSLKQHNFELFAFGVRGFGPLQQKLWLDEWLPRIQPDVVLWQFCFNDVFNCSYDLESTSYFNNNRRYRPYLENEKVVYKNPARLGSATLRDYSKFLDFVFTKVEVIIEGNDHKEGTASEDQIIEKGKDFKPYADGLSALNANVRNIKSAIGTEVPMLSFPVDTTRPYLNDMVEIFEQNNIPVITGIPELIAGDTNCAFAKDHAHWNENGHAIASEEIWKSLKPILKEANDMVHNE